MAHPIARSLPAPRSAVQRLARALRRRFRSSRYPQLPSSVEEFEKWVWLALQTQAFFSRRDIFEGGFVYYEFGTGRGRTLAAFLRVARVYARRTRTPLERFHVCCFDTFSGLPEARDDSDRRVRWTPGRFAKGKDEIAAIVAAAKFPMEQADLVEGLYEETLTPQLRAHLLERNLAPAIVMVDCDYYSSTRTVLDWLASMMRSGTLLCFDDTLAFHGHPEMGQLRAIREFNEQGVGHLFRYDRIGLLHKSYLFSAPKWEHA